MDFPEKLKYTKSHEWAKQENEEIIVGISAYAVSEISDVVFVELPDEGREIKAGDSVCVVESVKAAFDIFSPVSGTISAVNAALETNPVVVAEDTYGAGWFFKVTPSNAAELDALMDAEHYTAHVAAAKH